MKAIFETGGGEGGGGGAFVAQAGRTISIKKTMQHQRDNLEKYAAIRFKIERIFHRELR